MSDRIQFITTEDRQFTLAAVEAALRKRDRRYAIGDRRCVDGAEQGLLTYAGERYGEIAVASEGALLDKELAELRARADAAGDGRARVLELLAGARQVLCVGVLREGRGTEETLRRLDPLWSWLAASYDGLVHADGEGFYDGLGLVMAAE